MNLKLYDQSQFLKGGRIQEVIWIEELGELQHEITKSLRGMLSKTHLVEEFADVLICLEQLKIKYNISDSQLQEWIDYKYNRNCKRLEQENPPKKYKVSKMEYDILDMFINDNSGTDYVFNSIEYMSKLLGKGYFKGADGRMNIRYYFSNCETIS